MIAACYDLSLTCDGDDCEGGPYRAVSTLEIQRETGSACRKAARRLGWKLFMDDGRCLCPGCAKRGALVSP